MTEPGNEYTVRRQRSRDREQVGVENGDPHQPSDRPRTSGAGGGGGPRTTKQKVILGGISVVVAIVVVVAAGALWGWWSFSKIDRVDVKLSEVAAPTEPFNVLVVGSDSRKGITKNDPSASGMLGKDAPGGQRSDSLMVARIDLENKRIDLLSIPRDLWVPISGTGKSQRINTAYAKSAQATVDTIEKELNIPINHFAEVDFNGFRGLIDALGGVPMYFAHPVKDLNSGLNITEKGCTVLDGEMGLAFARSRHLKWYDGKKWVSDPSGDLGRMTRQQLLTRASMSKAQTLGLSDVTKVKGLVDATIDSIKLDGKWGAGDLISLGRQVSAIDPQRMQTHALPVVPTRTSGGAAVVVLDEAAAAPVLAIFRGEAAATPVTTTTLPPPAPGDVSVTVVNSSAPDGEGRRVSYVLDAGGFAIVDVLTGEKDHARTTVSHAPGQDASARLVAGWLSPTPEIVEDKKTPSGTVVVDLGSDFKRISEPSEDSTGDSGGGPATEHDGGTSTTHGSSGGGEGSSDSPTSSVPSTTTTTAPGWTPGVPPQGTVCR
ncbi:MAG: LCP family protein [Microthrixaceae bacterium]